MKKKRILSAALVLLLVASLPVTAFADTYDLANGSVEVSATENGQSVTQGSTYVSNDPAPVITSNGTSTTNTVTITAAENQTANVTLKDVNIDVSTTGGYDVATRSFKAGDAAVSTSGAGNVTIELEGENTVKSGFYRAGLEKNNDGSLTITDTDDNDGSLKATGGVNGAGIGGGWKGNGSDITISGGDVTATGGVDGAGIGGGATGNGSNIRISNAKVTAKGDGGGAGIGGGLDGKGSDITVSGDAQLKVQGGYYSSGPFNGAAIGGGGRGSGWDIGPGVDCTPDTSKLSPEGKIEYYAPGADMEKDAPIEDKTIFGKHEHQWVAGEVTKEPTCTETGVRIDTCISDETKSFTRTVELPLREHEFKDYFPDGNASCENDGTKTAKCVWYDQCGKEDTLPNEGGRLNHSFKGQEYVPDGNATCDEDGTKTIYCVRYGTNGCKEKHTLPNEGTKLNHSFEGQEYVPDGNASCEQDGSKTAKCVRYGIGGCTATDRIPDEGSRLPHTVVTDEAVAPTYTHTGLTEGSHCSVCEEVLKAQKVVPTLPLYRVTDEDGRDIRCKAERKNGVLTVTVDADYAILTGELRGVRALKAQGVERIEFITNSAISAFAPADLLKKGDRGETYHLTHDGETITFTLGAKKTDVSDILEGA